MKPVPSYRIHVRRSMTIAHEFLATAVCAHCAYAFHSFNVDENLARGKVDFVMTKHVTQMHGANA